MEKKVINIWTLSMSNWREAKKRGIQILDITAKGKSIFGPSMSQVMDYKQGLTTEEDYSRNYVARMEESKKRFPTRWEELLSYTDVAFACYCRPKVFCHRHLFKVIFEKYCSEKGYEVKQRGEIIKEN